MSKIGFAGLSGAFLLGVVSFGFNAAAAQDSFDQFQTAASERGAAIDYGAIDKLYDQVTVKNGDRYDFRYSVMNRAALGPLNTFAKALASLDPTTMSKDEQLAYWLNFRNLLVIRAIATDLPGRKFKRGRGTFDEPGELWTRKRLSVSGVSVSIDDIERKIILANWSDPNIIYGLYQGSEGGVAYYPAKNFNGAEVHDDLAERGRHFVNSRRVIRVRRDKATAPAIYDWYKANLFGGDDAAVLDHLRNLADDDLSADLANAEKVEFKKMDYDLDEVVVRQQRQQLPELSTRGVGGGGGSYGS